MRKRSAILLAIIVIGVFVITFFMTRSIDTSKTDERLIVLDSPIAEEWIGNPITVSGKVKSSWILEGMPIAILTNWDGLIIAEVITQKVGEVDKEGFQKFKADIKYEKPEYNERGFLIVQKSNPTRDPKKADAEEIMIYFK
jgi:hypothetical protein